MNLNFSETTKNKHIEVKTDFYNNSETKTSPIIDISQKSEKTHSIVDKAFQAVSKEQILSLCKFILAEVGKKLSPEVRLQFFASQIGKLEDLIKKIESAERIRIPEIKNALIEILAEEVNWSPRNSEIERNKKCKDYDDFLRWDTDFNTRILWNEVHPLTHLELPPNLLPDSWNDLLKLSREKYFRSHLLKIESFKTSLFGNEHYFNAAIISLAERCEAFGVYDFIDNTLLRRINDSAMRFSFEFDYCLRKKDFKRALDCACNVPQGIIPRFSNIEEAAQCFTEKVLWAVVKEKNGILLALNLILSLPNNEKDIVWLDDSIGKIKPDPITLRNINLNKLLFYVCTTQGLGKAIKFLQMIPYPKDRAILVNHLIFRLTQKDLYIERWDDCFQKVFKSAEKKKDSEEFWKINAIKDLDKEDKAFEEFENRHSLKKENLQEDIERAIEIFNHFPVGKFTKSKAQEEILTSLRSMYIIEALLRKKDQNTAKELLPYFRGRKTGLDRYVYSYEDLLRFGLSEIPIHVTKNQIYSTVSQFEQSQR